MKMKTRLFFVSAMVIGLMIVGIVIKLTPNYEEPETLTEIEIKSCKPNNLKAIKPKLTPVSYDDAETELSTIYSSMIKVGGYSEPKDCLNAVKVAIIVPYRDSSTQLAIFLRHIHPILLKQKLTYQIFVIDQIDSFPLNKGTIFNVGFDFAANTNDFDCFIFHDVNYLLENEKGLYNCRKSPFHMGRYVDKNNYVSTSDNNIGGVISFTAKDYLDINGHSNCYWGTGAEDDDIFIRLQESKMPIEYAKYNQYKYTINQVNDVKSDSEHSKLRNLMLKNASCRIDYDGLKNLVYETASTELYLLYTHVKIRLTQQHEISTPGSCKCI